MLLRIPWRAAPRPSEESRAWADYILQPLFIAGYAYMSWTVVRLFWTTILLPLYLLLAFCRSLAPALIANWTALFTSKGRVQLVHRGQESGTRRKAQGESQLRGKYSFAKGSFEPGWYREEKVAAVWPANREYFVVCGLRVCVVHEKPAGPVKRRLVLLHGNPSYSFMYRQIIPSLVSKGFEVFALDWCGFGGSDKPFTVEEISFELHMCTLVALFDAYQLEDAYILAHDWGGCVALSTLAGQILDGEACTGLMLLNSFFPPRPSDITWNAYLLYLMWLSTQGLLAGFTPEEAVIRYMAPSVTQAVASGYARPFSSIRSKAAVTRFARLVPGMPNFAYDFFESSFGRIIDGMCPTQTFSSLHEQLFLRKRDANVRRFWSSGESNIRVGVMFGDRDTLLGDFYPVLCRCIRTMDGAPKQHTLVGAGHYAAEEKPDEIVRVFSSFAGS